MAKGKSLLLGFLFGSVIGASTTLLTTPASGEDMRRRAKEQSFKAKEALLELKNEGIDLKQQLTRTSKEGVALLKDLSQDIATSIDSWKQTIEPHQANIQEHLQQVEESLRELEAKMTQVKNNEKQ